MATFAQRLRDLRVKRGLTQTELGSILNVAKQTISSYENEGSAPDYDTLQRIADYFGCSVDYLLGRTDDPRPLHQQIEDAVQDDPELKEFWDAFLSKRELRQAFRTIKDLDPASLRKIIRVIKAIEEEEGSYKPGE